MGGAFPTHDRCAVASRVGEYHASTSEGVRYIRLVGVRMLVRIVRMVCAIVRLLLFRYLFLPGAELASLKRFVFAAGTTKTVIFRHE